MKISIFALVVFALSAAAQDTTTVIGTPSDVTSASVASSTADVSSMSSSAASSFSSVASSVSSALSSQVSSNSAASSSLHSIASSHISSASSVHSTAINPTNTANSAASINNGGGVVIGLVAGLLAAVV